MSSTGTASRPKPTETRSQTWGSAAEGKRSAAFGRCRISVQGNGDDGRHFELAVTLLHYGAGVVERDRRPRECEELDGEWEWME